MASALHNLSSYDPATVPSGKGWRIGIVVSEWNEEVTGALLEGAYNTLLKHGVEMDDIMVKTVPGSFELVYGYCSCSGYVVAGRINQCSDAKGVVACIQT